MLKLLRLEKLGVAYSMLLAEDAEGVKSKNMFGS